MWVYPEIRTLGDLPSYHARRRPEAHALVFEGRGTSWVELESKSSRFAAFLAEGGIGRGDCVAYLGKNSDDFFIAMFGIAKAGAAFLPLNWRLASPEIDEVLQDSKPRLIIFEKDLAPLLPVSMPGSQAIPIGDDSRIDSYQAAGDDGKPLPRVSEDDVAILLYTSGTTGQPKGVLLTHGGVNRMRLCEHLEPAFRWEDDDSFLFNLPNFHLLGIGLSLQCLYNGLKLVIQRRFDPAATLAALGVARPTLLVLTPAMIQMLVDHPDSAMADFSSVRLTMYAGSPISLGLIRRAITVMPCRFMQFYGATESTGALSLLRPEEHDLSDESKLKSCGRPLPFIEFRIVDPVGREMPVGEPGELVVRSPAISAGYFNKPEATAAVFQRGWYATGDIAYRDEEGLYYIVDRAKDMIITGGENVYSAEVEHALSTHPAVSATAVIGVPDEKWGEAVKAVVVLKEGASADVQDLTHHCRSRLAGYKVPKSFDIVAELPCTSTGKIAKKELRAKYWSEHQRSVA
jgi:acyl-CoA synthetase (AMP-forming)/AMP-acid ligase II